MAIAMLGVLGVIVLVASLSTTARAAVRKKPTVEKPTAERSQYLKDLLERAKQGIAPLEAIRGGQKEAERLGLVNLSLSLDHYGDLLEEKQKIKEGVEEIIKTSLPSSFSSPLKGLPDKNWSKYVNRHKSAKAGFISPGYQLGIFQTGMRLLEDFDYVRNTKKGDYKGRQVWLGEWVSPYSLQRFLSDAKLQYKVFSQQTKRDARAIIKRHKQYLLGPLVEGEKASLSGLLAVAKHAGLAGLRKWLEGDRKERTTRVYKRYNGIF